MEVFFSPCDPVTYEYHHTDYPDIEVGYGIDQ